MAAKKDKPIHLNAVEHEINMIFKIPYEKKQLKNGGITWVLNRTLKIDFDKSYNTQLDQYLKILESRKVRIPDDLNGIFTKKQLKWAKNRKSYFDSGEYYYNILHDYVKFLNNKSSLLKKKKTHTKGFQSTLTDKHILTLFDQLQGSYIDNNTNPDHFKAMFKDEPLPTGFQPIKRSKSFTQTLCAYFVSELFQKENPNDYWSIAKNCFEVKDLKQSLNNSYAYNKGRKPKGYEKIDIILKNIYSSLQ